MGIIQRFADIIKANINDLIDKAEDPAKMVDQLLRDLTEQLAEVKSDTADVMAEEARCKRIVDKLTAEVQSYSESAKNALIAGNEGDAKVLIQKKQSLEAELAAATTTHSTAAANAAKMREMYDKLVRDIADLNSRKENIKAQTSLAEAQERLNATTSKVDTQSALNAFDRMEQKAQKRLDAAVAGATLTNETGDNGVEALRTQYTTGSASVDSELAAMKASLGIQ